MTETKVTERDRILHVMVQPIAGNKVMMTYAEIDAKGYLHHVRDGELSMESARNLSDRLREAVDTIIQQHSDTIDQSPHAKVRDVIAGRH